MAAGFSAGVTEALIIVTPFEVGACECSGARPLAAWTLIVQDSLDSYRNALACKQIATGTEHGTQSTATVLEP